MPWNQQSNSILEIIHQVLQDCLTTFELDTKDIDKNDDDLFDEYLAMASYAIRSGYHATHGYSPGELVFGRNMFMPVYKKIDWDAIKT